MFLKSLDIFGFKSFVDRTHIEFSDGITALLGPNGCGKSNVVDAVKWVLGEQSAKNMRAESMEDVIFNGTQSRKALNVAEVTLTISNEQGLLPLDISEITIKRRLYRSGESEYWINGTQAKLKNVRELFWDTGVGKAAYSVMEQGKIDQILSSRPEDRRYIFEEAAGITRFKAKRAEAERTLAKTEENMKQVDGILGEVRRSYDSLKIQADKTTKYRQLKDDVFNLELDIQLLRLKGFLQDQNNRKSDLEKATENKKSVQEELNALNSQLEEHMDEVTSMNNQLVDLQKKLVALGVEENAKKEQIKMLNERKNEVKQKLNQLEGRKAGIEERVETLREDTDNQESTVHTLSKRLEEVEKSIISFQENIQIASNRITENDKQSALCSEQIALLDKKRADLQVELQAITDDIVTELDSKLKEAGYSSSSYEKSLEKVNHCVSSLKVLASGRKKLFADFDKVSVHTEADVKRFSESAVNSFTEIENLTLELEDAVTEYTQKNPQFINEFLAPEGIITKKRELDSKIQDNYAQIENLKETIASLKSENSDLVVKINEYRETLEQMRINKAQMETQVKGAEDQLRILHRELASQEAELVELENELFNESKRLDDATEQLEESESELAEIQYKGRKVVDDLNDLENTIKNKNSDVSSKQNALEQKTKELSKHQSLIEKLNLEIVTTETEIRNLKENFKESHSRDLMEFEEHMYTITELPVQLREKLATAKNALRNIGSVNLMAIEEFAETKERFDFLSSQLADLQKAKDDLTRITEEIRAESTEQFLATYNKIKKNFHNMFRRLFGGGRAELHLVDPQNVLESGIDILAQPPGKKLESIALLSGGEKTMTAVALLFATYMVRPSPFCLLDEIDAALDEQNVLRFVQTLREFGNISQYIVITHNKKTVAGASTLLGVTMEEQGVSKVITIKLEENGRIVLPDPEPFEEEEVEPETNVFIPPHPPKRTGRNYASGLIVEKAVSVKPEETQVETVEEKAVSTETEIDNEINNQSEETLQDENTGNSSGEN